MQKVVVAGANLESRSFSSFHKELTFTCAGLVAVVIVYRDELAAFDPGKWATLSAWILLVLGLFIARQLDARFVQMLNRLRKRHVISLPSSEFEDFVTKLICRAKVASLIGAIALPAVLLVAYAITYSGLRWNMMVPVERTLLLGEVALEAVCAMIVGRYIGKGIFYGMLGQQMEMDGVPVNLIFGHSDHAAGLRPIGDFYFFQAAATALPVVFFTFWILMMPVWPTVWTSLDYEFAERWKNTYLAFFFLAIAVEVLAFMLPLWFFHRTMARQKQELLPRADELSAELCQLQRERTASVTLQQELPKPASLVEQIELIETLPTWPLAPDVRNRFAFGNLAFLAPPAAKMSQTVLEAFSAGLK